MFEFIKHVVTLKAEMNESCTYGLRITSVFIGNKCICCKFISFKVSFVMETRVVMLQLKTIKKKTFSLLEIKQTLNENKLIFTFCSTIK